MVLTGGRPPARRDGDRSGRHGRARWLTGVVLLLAVGVTAGLLLGSRGRPAPAPTALPTAAAVPSSVPTSAPTVSSSPAGGGFVAPPGTLTLPGPARTVGGVGVGYPHSTVGAISAAAQDVAAVITLDPAAAARAVRTVATAQAGGTLAGQVAAQVRTLRVQLGVPATGDVGDASVSFAAQAYQVKHASTDSVLVWILGTSTATGPATGGTLHLTPVASGYVLDWSGGDWKVTGQTVTVPGEDEVPAGTAPAYAKGWHDCVLNS